MKSRYLAGYSLAVMGAGFLVMLFLPQNSWVKLLLGGFEAGLVGGFADWFAVTALFRHPMGIPIPHTSLLLKNRNKIVNSLISALETELLNKESITSRLRQMKLFQSVSTGLFKLIRRKEVRMKLLSSLEQAVRELPLEKAAPHIRDMVLRYIHSRNITELLNRVVKETEAHQLDEKVLDYGLLYAAEWVNNPDNEMMLGKLAHAKLDELQLGGMKGFAVQAMLGFMNEEKMGAILKKLILSALLEVANPESPYRERVVKGIRERLAQVADSPETESRVKGWLDDKLSSENAEAWIAGQLNYLRERLLQWMEAERERGGRIWIRLFRWCHDLLQSKEELTHRWEQGVLAMIVQLVESNYYRIGVLVRENLDKLDDQSLVNMLEEKVGSDLQWIRVNGAICGFVIGIVLSAIHLLILNG
ncbi:DUF445 domain-containing protein [Paenibacillus sp. Y412MC10]|uniref:DUF445 domain-containing protein n=1 Tax=Geobacillus sp. (strain Y412MC10) TaxID=481743 RepID=UPI00164273C3|nr:DUF445 domain-containing protein [Paenibacillus sp. Y412MC10]